MPRSFRLRFRNAAGARFHIRQRALEFMQKDQRPGSFAGALILLHEEKETPEPEGLRCGECGFV